MQEEPGPSAKNVHASLLDAIWNRPDGQATDAGKVAAASIDKAVNPPTAAMAAHEAANSISSYVDFAKWSDMDGFTDSDENGDILCSCGKVSSLAGSEQSDCLDPMRPCCISMLSGTLWEDVLMSMRAASLPHTLQDHSM